MARIARPRRVHSAVTLKTPSVGGRSIHARAADMLRKRTRSPRADDMGAALGLSTARRRCPAQLAVLEAALARGAISRRQFEIAFARLLLHEGLVPIVITK